MTGCSEVAPHQHCLPSFTEDTEVRGPLFFSISFLAVEKLLFLNDVDVEVSSPYQILQSS